MSSGFYRPHIEMNMVMFAHTCRGLLSIGYKGRATVALGVAAALIAGHGVGHAEESAACADLSRETISGNVSLDGQCVYNSQISITASDTHLNCNGAIFDGQGRLTVGLTISSQGNSLKNVKVENCVFRNYAKHGMFVTAGIPDYKKRGTHEELYASSPSDIRLTKITTENNARSGVYIDDYVTKLTLENSVIRGSGKSGIYLEHSSSSNIIRNNLIEKNGFSTEDDSLREAVAIDSSAGNIIEGNYFSGNGAGGIFLYKNCGERANSGKSVQRWQHSDKNIIRRNSFNGEPVGIWIASRQSRNLVKWDCGDRPMDKAGRYFEDFANNNFVENNEFCATNVGIRIEGDLNQVRNNKFDAKTKIDVEIPATKREILLGRPPENNKIVGSNYGNCSKKNTLN